MRHIDLIYNPYTCRAGLHLDGAVYARPGSRLQTMLIGHSMADWLNYRTVSYQRWRGLLPELMDEFNDDELAITFSGLYEDYQLLASALEQQKSAVAQAGYADDCWTLAFKESTAFTPKAVHAMLLDLRKNAIPAPTQALLLELKMLDEHLRSAKEPDIAQISDFLSSYLRLFNACKQQCPPRQAASWENAARQLKAYLW